MGEITSSTFRSLGPGEANWPPETLKDGPGSGLWPPLAIPERRALCPKQVPWRRVLQSPGGRGPQGGRSRGQWFRKGTTVEARDLLVYWELSSEEAGWGQHAKGHERWVWGLQAEFPFSSPGCGESWPSSCPSLHCLGQPGTPGGALGALQEAAGPEEREA